MSWKRTVAKEIRDVAYIQAHAENYQDSAYLVCLQLGLIPKGTNRLQTVDGELLFEPVLEDEVEEDEE